MEFTSPFKKGVFKPLATILIPGTVAILPYVLHLLCMNVPVAGFFEKHEIAFLTLVTFAIIATGFVLEDLGAVIESKIWDRLIKQEKSVWWEYLRTCFKEEPMGQEYLRSVVLRMKFELSFALALIPMWLGLSLLSTFDLIFSVFWWRILTFVVVGLFIYLIWESYQSCKLLAQIRLELAKGVIVKP